MRTGSRALKMKPSRLFLASLVGMVLVLQLLTFSAEVSASVQPQLSSKSGAVYTREIVRDTDGNPIFVEYDAAGHEVAGGLIRPDTPDVDYQVLSGVRYRAMVAQYQALQTRYTDNGLALPQLLDKQSYLATTFVTQDNETITKPALRNDTVSVVVSPETTRYSTDGDQLLLLELPINPEQTISDTANSILLTLPDAEVVYETTNNIGYRVGFYGSGSDVSTSTRRTTDDDIFGPLRYVPVDLVSFDRTTTTDDTGKYRLDYYLPPCPGFSYEMNSLTAVKLYFKRFNPQGSPTKAYSLFQWGKESCDGYYSASFSGPILNLEAVSGNSTSVTRNLDFPIDIMVLSGHAALGNDETSAIPLGTTTQYDASGGSLTRVAQQSYDMDGDGVKDLALLGGMVEQADGSTRFSTESTPSTLQGVWLSTVHGEITTPPTDTPPDLTRLADWSADFNDRALLSAITAKDLKDTDLYVFRESDGSLLMERQGTDENESYIGVNTEQQKFAYTLRLVGSRGRLFSGTVGEGDGDEFRQWQVDEGVVDNSPLYLQAADHLRPGEKVRIIAINRASGYLGSLSVPLQAAGNEGTNLEISFNVDDIQLLPPNLKVWAERQSKTGLGMTKDEINRYLVGSEGAGMSDDQFIVIYSEWLDPEGLPLPEELADYGYTARLARIVAENTLETADSIDNIAIKPGRQMALIRLPERSSTPDNNTDYFAGNEHFYVQVSGQPSSRKSDFSSGGQTAMLQHRPDKFVPLLTPVYDENTTNLSIQAWNSARQVNTDLKRPEPVYQWVYRPEYQFSVYDLQVKAITREDVLGQTEDILQLSQPVISSSDEAVQLLYDLTGPSAEGSSLNTLSAYSYGENKELVFAFGEQEVSVTLAADGKIIFDDPSQLLDLKPEDYLSIRLYANNDPENVLWEWNFNTLDVDIDSDNNNGYDMPDRSNSEESVEALAGYPGKIIDINDGDVNGNDVPDFAEFAYRDKSGQLVEAQFIPFVIEVPPHVNIYDDKSTLSINYYASDPMKVTSVNHGTPDEPDWVYTPASGAERVWKVNADVVRSPLSADMGGDYVAPNIKYKLTDLGFSDAQRVIAFYIEGINKTETGDAHIEMFLEYDR